MLYFVGAPGCKLVSSLPMCLLSIPRLCPVGVTWRDWEMGKIEEQEEEEREEEYISEDSDGETASSDDIDGDGNENQEL